MYFDKLCSGNKFAHELIDIVTEECHVEEGDGGLDVPLGARELAVAAVVSGVHCYRPLCFNYN